MFVSSSIGSKRDGHLSGSSAKGSSAKRGEVSVLLAMYGESKVEVPGVVRSVKAPEGGADIESTMRSLGDTVCRFGVCAGAGSLMGAKCVPKTSDSLKRTLVGSGTEVRSLLKSNMLSEGTSKRVMVSSGSKLEEPSGDAVPSKSGETAMVDIFC